MARRPGWSPSRSKSSNSKRCTFESMNSINTLEDLVNALLRDIPKCFYLYYTSNSVIPIKAAIWPSHNVLRKIHFEEAMLVLCTRDGFIMGPCVQSEKRRAEALFGVNPSSNTRK